MRYPLILLTTCGLLAAARPAAAQTPSAALDANNVLAPVSATTGTLWETSTGLQVPRVGSSGQPPRSTVSQASLWLGGTDASGYLYTAAETYRQNGRRGFWNGPIGGTTGDDPAYGFVWKVTRAEINDHRANYAQPSYQAPASILSWPARTAGYGGASALAPFVDTNANGTYEPLAGDYPDVPGDQALFTIVNDAAGVKEPFSPAMGVEVQTLVYAYNTGTYSAGLDHSIFVRYRVANHSAVTYNDAYLGHHVDFDIGYFNDDYVGCDSLHNMAFGYNADAFDEGVLGYGANPPTQAVLALSDPLGGFMGYNNDYSVTGNPTTAQHYYNYLRGRWLDGRGVTYGSNGYLGNGRSTRFMYSGNSTSSNFWTESNTDGFNRANTPGDRRGLLTFGPFTFAPGDVHTLELAYLFDWPGQTVPLADAVTTLLTGLSSGALATAPDLGGASKAFSLAPNPAHHGVSLPGAPAGPVELLDGRGRVVRTQPAAAAAPTTLDLRGLPAGLYLVRAAGQTRRLVVE